MELAGLDTVPRTARDNVRQFATLLGQKLGADLVSLALFGPVCSLDFDPRRDAVQSVVVLGMINLQRLRELAAEGSHLARRKIAAPLVMTPPFLAASRDSYPLELIEIQQQHVLLCGSDPFQELKFEKEHVRLECERELKSIAIGMRQGLLGSAGEERQLRPIVDRTIGGLLRTIRGLYWLKVSDEPQPWPAMIEAIETLAGQPLPGIRRARTETAPYDWQEFVDLYHDVDVLGHFTDAW